MKRVRLLRAALLGIAALLLASCSESSPTGVKAPADLDALFGLPLDPPAIGLVQCTPLPYDSVTQTIGPEGGTLFVGDHRLTVPAGALDTDVTITAVAPSDTLRHVRFQPEGLTFQQPAWLTLSYAGCNLLGSFAPKRIAYTTDVFEIIEYLLSFDNLWTRRVTGRVQHFSEYAIAW
jgi:hypothetical protein